MSFESRPAPHDDFGSLQGCFVEGSSEQRARERRIRRRSLILSILAQTAVVTAIILVPLFGKPERIAFANPIPIPPYYSHSAPAHPQPQQAGPTIRTHNICATCYNPTALNKPLNTMPDPPNDTPPGIGPGDGRQNSLNQLGINMFDSRRQPTPPTEDKPRVPKRIVMTRLEPAMLIYRLEPVYPPIAKQIHREGKVELRAIIATDGTIKSLQVVSGEPWFIQSATAAVSQWRYRPTVLNGQPVEIDTFITVFYNLQH